MRVTIISGLLTGALVLTALLALVGMAGPIPVREKIEFPAWYALQVAASSYANGLNYQRYTEEQCAQALRYIEAQRTGARAVCVPVPFTPPAQPGEPHGHP